MDFLLLNMYLGSVTFIIGIIVLVLILRKITARKLTLTLIVVTQSVISIFLSLAIWCFWILDVDIVFLFISIPALIAECITIPIVLFLVKMKGVKRFLM